MSLIGPIQVAQEEVVEELNLFQGLELYDELMAQAKYVPLIAPENKTADRLVKGCQSKVWLHPEYQNGRIHFTADSDAFVSKGMTGLLLRVFNDRTPEELITASLEFLERTGLKGQLTIQRSGGLASILDQMKRYALAYSSQS